MNNDLHQWYMDIDAKLESVRKYEDAITKYHKNLKINLDPNMIKPFLTEFYKRDKFSKHVKSIILSSIIPSLILGGLTFLVSLITKIIKYDDGFIEAIKNIESLIALPIILAVVVLFACVGLSVLFHFLVNKTLIKKLSTYEQELRQLMISVPTNYRSFNKLTLISHAYYAVKGLTPEEAFKACDATLKSLPPRIIPGVMFDLPFKNSLVKDKFFTAGELKAESTESDYEYENEFLPSDIKQKTFAGSTNAQIDLEKMIGLDSVKDQVEKLQNRIKFYGANSANGNHMMFVGSAGTGKTSVARIITKIMFDLGYIKKNQYVEISGDYLRSGSSDRALAIIEYSYGGVLFIDEAYLLYDKDGRGNDAIGILLKAMEDHRKDFVVILAGYEEQMTRLIASNEGFSSRIKHTIYFSDYTVEEMFDIFSFFIKNYNGKSYTIAEDAIPTLKSTFELEKKAKSFGNARTVRNAVDAIMDYYVDRSIATDTDTHIISIEDVENYSKDRKVALQHELKNSSAANQVDESIIRLSELKSKVQYGSDAPITDFNNLVGLTSFKQELDLLKNQKEFYNKADPQKILLIGPQNCGKRSLVKILTGYLYSNGYIDENKYLDISADFLKGSYVGHTTKRAESIISYATGGVLYIRDINMVANSDDAFAKEVLAAITNALSTDLTIIIGDYDSDYIRSISNMFNIVYNFPTYTGEHLASIFVNKAKEDNFTITDAAFAKVKDILANKSSVRDALNLYNNAKKKHIANFTEDTRYILTDLDIEKPFGVKIKFNS